MSYSHTFSRAWRRLHVFALSPDWFIELTVSIVIDQNNDRSNCISTITEKPIDLVFALGGAGRITQDTFRKQKDFIKQFLDTYAVSAPGIHISVINYGSGEILAEFKNYDTDNLKDKVDGVRLTPGGTVESALRSAQRQVFGDRKLLRSYAIKALIVLTGERVNEGDRGLRDASSALTGKGIKIVAVAVGRTPDRNKLRVFTSGEEYVFDFTRNGDLPSLVPRVYEVIIKGNLHYD